MLNPNYSQAEIDEALSLLVDQGLISMGWDEKQEAVVFFLTPEQLEKYREDVGT